MQILFGPQKKYCNILPINFLKKEIITKYLSKYSNKFNIILFNTLNSTNQYLIDNYSICKFDNLPVNVVSTEFQFNGCGRYNRKWYSSLCGGLTFSFPWCFSRNISTISSLGLVIGIAIIRVLRRFVDKEIHIKWPNDIVYGRSKLAGILIELRSKINGPSVAIIGIGINFYLPSSISSYFDQDVTDLSNISEKRLDRNEIFGYLLVELYKVLRDFEKYNFTFFKEEWISYHAYQGKSVKLTLPNNESAIGVVDGINDDGSIRLITATSCYSYHSGNITMRLNN